MSGLVRSPDAKFAPAARPADGIDYAKHARLAGDLDIKRAGLHGALLMKDELFEMRDSEARAVHLGMSEAGRQMWASSDMAELLTWSDEALRDGRVDVAAVRRCLALKDRCKRAQQQVDALHAEMAPLVALLARCDKYLQGV